MDSLDITRATWVEIDLDNLAYNMSSIKNMIGDDRLLTAVVKADAYGHGAIRVGKTFLENGADRLAVATLTEAIELRRAEIKEPIMVLGYTPEYQFPSVIDGDIIQTIYDLESAKLLSKEAVKMDKEVKIHIKVDTGMGRLGFLPSRKSIEELVQISKLPNLNIEGIYTHFSTADIEDKTYTNAQYEKFTNFTQELEKENIVIPIKHVSNSGAIIDLPDYNLDMVRAGIMSYGLYPSDYVNKEGIPLKTAMVLKTKVAFVKEVPAGTSISYSRNFITEKKSKIATLPIGYADGYPRFLAGKAEAFVKGSRVPVVGNICMDQIMIDVSEIDDILMGDEVVLFGDETKGHPHVDEIANKLHTINYEVVCMVSRRVPRVYIQNGNIVEVKDYLLQ